MLTVIRVSVMVIPCVDGVQWRRGVLGDQCVRMPQRPRGGFKTMNIASTLMSIQSSWC